MKPILFNTEMVRAILDGRKTVTRRVVKPQPVEVTTPNGVSYLKWKAKEFFNNSIAKYGPYRPGDILYVRETFAKPYGGIYRYKADYHDHDIVEADIGDVSVSANLIRWSPSIHMPREAARIFLRVTDVRVERLRPMGLDDFEAEGLSTITGIFDTTARFADLWDSTIKPADRALYGWDVNPWVWVIEFERCKKPEREDNNDRT